MGRLIARENGVIRKIRPKPLPLEEGLRGNYSASFLKLAGVAVMQSLGNLYFKKWCFIRKELVLMLVFFFVCTVIPYINRIY